MDAATVDTWIASTPGLKQYAFYLHDILRRKAHTLSASEEALMAQTSPMAAGSGTSASILLNADLPWPTVTLVRRQAGEARRPGVLGGARVGEPGGSEEGDGRLLHRARQLPQDPRRHDERERAGRDLPRAGQALRHDARRRARRGQHPDLGLQGARGQRQQAAAVVPAVPRAAEAHPRPRRAALLRPLRAAGEGRPAHLHRRAGADQHQGGTGAARRRITSPASTRPSRADGSTTTRRRARSRAPT